MILFCSGLVGANGSTFLSIFFLLIVLFFFFFPVSIPSQIPFFLMAPAPSISVFQICEGPLRPEDSFVVKLQISSFFADVLA